MRKILLSLLLAPIAGTHVHAQIEVLPPPSFIDTTQYYEVAPVAINNAGTIAGGLFGSLTAPVNCPPGSLNNPTAFFTNGPFMWVKGQTLYPQGVCNATNNASAIDNQGRSVVQGFACNGLMSSDGSCLSISYNDGTYSGGPTGISNNGIYVVGMAQSVSDPRLTAPIFVVWQWSAAKRGYQVVGAGYVPFQGGAAFQNLANCQLPPLFTSPTAGFINNQGQFLVSISDLSGNLHGVVYSAAGGFTMVADLGPQTNACALNNIGQIAGENTTTGAGFVYDLNTASFDNFTVNGSAPVPTGINDGGQVVLFAPSGGDIHTYVRSRTGLCVTDIGTLPNLTAPGAQFNSQLVFGRAINNAGVVVGTENDPYEASPPGAVWRGFRYRPTVACGDEH